MKWTRQLDIIADSYVRQAINSSCSEQRPNSFFQTSMFSGSIAQIRLTIHVHHHRDELKHWWGDVLLKTVAWYWRLATQKTTISMTDIGLCCCSRVHQGLADIACVVLTTLQGPLPWLPRTSSRDIHKPWSCDSSFVAVATTVSVKVHIKRQIKQHLVNMPRTPPPQFPVLSETPLGKKVSRATPHVDALQKRVEGGWPWSRDEG